MTIDESDAALRIVEAGRRRARERMRDAFAAQLDAHPEVGEIDPDVLDRLLDEATNGAGASLWRISLAEGAAEQFGVSVSEALAHPAVAAAQQLVDAPAEPVAPPADDDALEWIPEPEPEPDPSPEPDPIPGPEPEPIAEPTATEPPQALRIAAVHNGGIEALEPGDKDIELLLSDVGVDVIKRSSGVAIGRLAWSEVTSIELEQSKRGLRGRRTTRSLQLRTGAGQAAFELVDLSEEESADHLEPLLARLRSAGSLGA